MKNNLFWDIETTGLDYLNDRITCISVITSDEVAASFIDEQEKVLLENFISWIKKRDKHSQELFPELCLLGWNSDNFDEPFFNMRCLKHKINTLDLPVYFRDVKTIFKQNPKTDKRPSFKQALKFLGLRNKNGDGLRAIYLWELRHYNLKMLDELQIYCENDAYLVKVIYDKLIEGGM